MGCLVTELTGFRMKEKVAFYFKGINSTLGPNSFINFKTRRRAQTSLFILCLGQHLLGCAGNLERSASVRSEKGLGWAHQKNARLYQVQCIWYRLLNLAVKNLAFCNLVHC